MPLNYCILATACCFVFPSQKEAKTQQCRENTVKYDQKKVLAESIQPEKEMIACFSSGAVR